MSNLAVAFETRRGFALRVCVSFGSFKFVDGCVVVCGAATRAVEIVRIVLRTAGFWKDG